MNEHTNMDVGFIKVTQIFRDTICIYVALVALEKIVFHLWHIWRMDRRTN